MTLENQGKPESAEEQFFSSTPPLTPPPVQATYMAHLIKFPPLSKEELGELRKHLVSRPLAWLICIALAAVADWLFWNQPCGMTLGIFVLLLGGAAFFSMPQKRIVMLPAVMVVISGAALMVQLSFWGVLLAVLSLISMVAISRAGCLQSVREWSFVVAAFIKQALPQSFTDMLSFFAKTTDNNSVPQTNRRAKNIFLLLLFSLIFLILFLIANPVLSKHASKLGDYIEEWMGEDIPSHIFFWLMIIFIGWMCMRFCMRAFNDTNRLAVKLPTLSGDFTTQCLVAFNIVFLLQTCTDIFYLWSGASLPEGLTYAQYAHRGAYPLAIAAILAGVFMVFAWGDNREKCKPTPVRSVLATLWLAQNVFLMVCAAWRLYLYVSAYSMTHLRFIAGVGMVLVALGFITIAVRIYRAKTANWLLTVNAATITLAMIFCAFFNTSGWIADFNVAHCSEVSSDGASLDMGYMHDLLPESLPAMMRYMKIPRNVPAALAKTDIITINRRNFEADMKNWRYRTLQRTETLRSLKNYDRPINEN